MTSTAILAIPVLPHSITDSAQVIDDQALTMLAKVRPAGPITCCPDGS